MQILKMINFFRIWYHPFSGAGLNRLPNATAPLIIYHIFFQISSKTLGKTGEGFSQGFAIG